jgi:NAD(P)-dependent dehydrogenase (short-subunit alcohol dehydrogenase family)
MSGGPSPAATVYVTGASAGLGRAIAAVFAKAGYAVGLIARDEDNLAKTARELGPRVAWASADVADFAQLEDAAEKLAGELGPPGIWINDAMATVFSRFDEIAPEEFARVMNVTFLGSVHGVQLALRYMKEQRKGHIIQIGSALAYRAIPLQAPYCSAKLAIRGAIDSLRCELIHDRSPIRVSMVHMPAMNTPQFDWARRHIAQQPQPVPPIFSPEACAEAVLWNARHPDQREVWVGKPTVEAIVANRLFPAIMDYYMARRAFDSQFERPAASADKTGNLFAPVGPLHKTEGHFARRQRSKVHWVGTSWRKEALSIAAVAALVVAGLAGGRRLIGRSQDR